MEINPTSGGNIMTDVTTEGGTLISATPATIASLSLSATKGTDPTESMVYCWLYDLSEVPDDLTRIEPVFGCFIDTLLKSPASLEVPLTDLPADQTDFQNGVVLELLKGSNTVTATITTS